jgi:sugar O-acyltransferase (sialic acid O-acetyltransferase NeuD family)
VTAPIVLVGGGRFVREIIPILRESGRIPVGILDDRHGELPDALGGVPVRGPIASIGDYGSCEVVVSVAASRARAAVVQTLTDIGIHEDQFLTVVDPSVRNPGGCEIGRGSILFAHVSITADAVIGRHVVAMPGVSITHDCRIDDFVTMASGVSLGGGVEVGTAAYLGMNAAVRQELRIGAHSTIGMGAAVLSHVPEDEIWAGVPARRLVEKGLR